MGNTRKNPGRGRPRKDWIAMNLTPDRAIAGQIKEWAEFLEISQTEFIERASSEMVKKLEKRYA